MKKILIVAKDDFTEEVYSDVFQEENFEVVKTQSGGEVLNLAIKENPDIILINIFLKDINGFEVLKDLKNNPSTNEIPVIILATLDKEEQRKKAVDLEARDFIVSTKISPRNTVLRIRTILGEERTYQIPISEKSGDIIQLYKDLGYEGDLRCSKCGSPLELYLMRDLGRGEDYFKVSFVCPKCS